MSLTSDIYIGIVDSAQVSARCYHGSDQDVS